MGLFRRRKGKNASPAREDTMSWPAWHQPGRYLEIREIDNWRPLPFQVPPPPDRETELRAVDQHVESLRGALDEGTSAALDPLIKYRLAGWLATVDTEYADHTAVIDIHRGQAVQWLTDSKVLAQHEREKLEQIRADYLASRARLGGAAVQDLRRNQA
jgi:hypothetical protein